MTAPIPATPLLVVSALRSAAAQFRTGRIEWGTDDFRVQDSFERVPSCCALGGISHAVDPANRDGDPNWVNPDGRPIAIGAMRELADYLVTELGAIDAGNYSEGDGRGRDWQRDPIEVVGDWNDAQPSVDTVIAALDAAADRLAARLLQAVAS